MWLHKNSTSNVPSVKPEHLYKRKKYIPDPDSQSVSFKPNNIYIAGLKGRGLHKTENKPVNAKHRKKEYWVYGILIFQYSFDILLWKLHLLGFYAFFCISPSLISFDIFPFELGSCNHWTAGKKYLIFTCLWKAIVGNCVLAMRVYHLFFAWQPDCYVACLYPREMWRSTDATLTSPHISSHGTWHWLVFLFGPHPFSFFIPSFIKP